MKYIYIFIVLSLFSCGEKIKEEKAKQVVVQEIVEQAEAADAMEAISDESFENLNFEVISLIQALRSNWAKTSITKWRIITFLMSLLEPHMTPI
mgnify:CR=1 FL=1